MLAKVGNAERVAVHMAGEVSIVAIVKGEERYVFMFDDDTRAETLRKLGQFASNPELSFTWYDAAVLSQKVRETPKSSDPAIPSGFDIAAFDRNGKTLQDELIDLHNEEMLNQGLTNEDLDLFPDVDFQSPDDIWIGDDPTGQ